MSVPANDTMQNASPGVGLDRSKDVHVVAVSHYHLVPINHNSMSDRLAGYRLLASVFTLLWLHQKHYTLCLELVMTFPEWSQARLRKITAADLNRWHFYLLKPFFCISVSCLPLLFTQLTEYPADLTSEELRSIKSGSRKR